MHTLIAVSPKIKRMKRRINMTEKLKAVLSKMQEEHNFQLGDIVQWKPNAKNRLLPLYSQPVIIVDYVPDLVDPKELSDSMHFRENIELCIGLLDADDNFICFWVDKDRMEPYQP